MARRKFEASEEAAIESIEAAVHTCGYGEIPKLQEMYTLWEEPGPGRTEVLYRAGELAENAGKVFGTNPECILAAFKAAGWETATVEQAKEQVKKFLNKEVQ